MIYHLVLFKLAPSITKTELDLFYSGLESLKSIDGVISIKYGSIDDNFYHDYQSRANGFTHSLIVTLKDVSSLEFYDKHSFHQKVKENFIYPYLDKTKEQLILAADFIDQNPIKDKTFYKYASIWAISSALTIGLIAAFPFIRSRL